MAANWVRTELLGRLNREDIEIGEAPVSPRQLGGTLLRIADGTISGKIAKSVFDALWNGETDDADSYIEANGLRQVSDMGELEPVIREIVENNPEQVEQYRAGKTKVLGFFVGQAMKATGGKANPQQVNELVRRLLDA